MLLCQVTRTKKWKELGVQVANLPKTSSASYQLRNHYKRYLLPFECAFERGGANLAEVIASVETKRNKKTPAVNTSTLAPPPPPQGQVMTPPGPQPRQAASSSGPGPGTAAMLPPGSNGPGHMGPSGQGGQPAPPPMAHQKVAAQALPSQTQNTATPTQQGN